MEVTNQLNTTGQFKKLETVLQERGRRYGKFKDHAVATQRLKDCIEKSLEEFKGRFLSPDKQEALDMICHKIGRVITGDENYADSWVDIAGYAQLIANDLQGGPVNGLVTSDLGACIVDSRGHNGVPFYGNSTIVGSYGANVK